MAKYTLHNKYGDYMSDYSNTLLKAKEKCDKAPYDCIVMESYMAPSPFKSNIVKITEHGKEVYRNF